MLWKHLLQEVVDNSLDQIANGYATHLTVDIVKTGHFIVTDNGKGIPIIQVEMPDGTMQDSIIAATTKLFSGEKFDDYSNEINLGMHGIGLVAVNALSLFLSVSIKDRLDKKKIHIYKFQDAILVEHRIIEYDIPWSTRIEFETNSEHFDTLEINQDKVKNRLALVSAHHVKSKNSFNGVETPKGTMEQFVKYILGLDENIPIFSTSFTRGVERAEVFFAYDPLGISAHRGIGDVNLNMCEGTYLTNFATLFTKTVTEYLKNNPKITKSDILNQFRFYLSLSIKAPKFDSQHKGKMTKNVSCLINKLKTQITTKLHNFNDRFDNIIEVKSMQKASQILGKKGTRISSDNKLQPCERFPGEVLYIFEGDSAEGTMRQIRDSKTEALFPLGGKILNSINKPLDKALDSKKVLHLFEAIGINFVGSGKKSRYRCKKIKILCDADADGMHIVTLLSIILWRYAHDLILNQKVSIIMPPLYGAVKGKSFIPLYSKQELTQYNNGSYNIVRFKGLGEMSPNQLEVVIKNPREYTLQLPANDREAQLVTECMTNTELKRKICRDPRFGIEKLNVQTT